MARSPCTARVVLAAPLALLLALVACSPAGAGGAATRLQVTQIEYRLGLSSTVVKAGRVSLLQLDRGHEQHDLRLRGPGGELKGKLLRPGTRWEGVVYLRPGTYKLWCSLPEHAKRGMHATLRVVR